MKINLEKACIGFLVGILLYCLCNKKFLIEGINGQVNTCKGLSPTCDEEKLCWVEGDNVCSANDQKQCEDAGFIWCGTGGKVETCDDKLQRLCGQHKGDAFQCAKCGSDNQQELKSAGCSNYDISAWCAGAPSPGPAPPTPPCPEAEKIAKDRGLDKLPQCTNEQCFKVNEDGIEDRVCGDNSTYTNGADCGNCEQLRFFGNKNNICILTENCKKNTCLTENIQAEYYESGKLIFKNSTNDSMYVVIENHNSDYIKIKNTPNIIKGQYDFYEVRPDMNLTFDLNKNDGEWLAGKAFIIKNPPNDPVFNGNALGGLEWTIKRDTDREGRTGMIASANLSAVDGINFNAKMKIYNVVCGGVNMKETNLNFNDCPFKGTNADGLQTCKTPDIQEHFINSNCPQAVVDACGPNWKKSDACYYTNIKNKFDCLEKWAQPNISANREEWLDFIGDNSIYSWSYDEIQILQPQNPPYFQHQPLPEYNNWKSSQHYKCISDFECDEKCYGFVGNNPRKPLVSCLVPSRTNPSIVFTIKDIM